MGKKILIVEDSVTVVEQLRQALTPAGFEISTACDGVEGLRVIRSESDVAMIICDVNMPRMDGIQMIEILKLEDCKIPILMLTTEGEPELIKKAKAAGARGWLIKPFEARLLVKAVNSLVG